MNCPNCGGGHSLSNPGIMMVVCEYCQTSFYWDENAVLQSGKKSVVPEGDTRLYQNATGKAADKAFQVIGHVRYDHGRGTWDEFFVEYTNGESSWISEDGRKITAEREVTPAEELPPANLLTTGHPVIIEGVHYTVREIGTALCAGGEGQLPFPVIIDERYVYADLTSIDGESFASIEYDEIGKPHCFAGTPLGHTNLKLDEERRPDLVAGIDSSDAKCPDCGSPLAQGAAGEDAQTVVCEYCGSQVNLTGAKAVVMGANPKDFDPKFVLDIGQSGTIEGTKYEVCGRMVYRDAENYFDREYILYNAKKGNLWLNEYNGHYTLIETTTVAPSRNPFLLDAGENIFIGGTKFRRHETGFSTLHYVDGALPWLASTGDSHQFVDLVTPGEIFSCESEVLPPPPPSGDETDDNDIDEVEPVATQEVEYFKGKYLPAPEVWKTFKLKGSAPEPQGVHAAQPTPKTSPVYMLAGLFAIINLLMLFGSCSDGDLILQQDLKATHYLKGMTTNTFEVGPGSIIGIELYAPVNDSWVALEMAFVDSEDNVVQEVSGGVSYYSGVEGGERWSEGSKDNTDFIKAPPAGSYRLMLKGAGGKGGGTTAGNEAIKIKIYQGATLSRFYIMLFIFFLIFALIGPIKRMSFEGQKWSELLGDDDDD
ncbi:DUF4178 domain-containing protein [Myxococcota bacterium]|nr:DUF4178 domain-containing protein [Myxococcota bacterium]